MMNRLLLSTVTGLLGLLLATPLAFGRGGHGGGGHGGGHGGGGRGTGHHATPRHNPTTRNRAVNRNRTTNRRPGARTRPGTRRVVRHVRHRRHLGGNGVVVAGGGGTVIDGTSGVAPAVDGDGDEADEGGLPFQTVRYLKINNKSGQTLTVYAQTPDDKEPRKWEFEPGEVAYLSVAAGKKLVAGEVWVWAEGGDRKWDQYKDESLVLVEEEYQAEDVGTYTYTFNP